MEQQLETLSIGKLILKFHLNQILKACKTKRNVTFPKEADRWKILCKAVLVLCQVDVSELGLESTVVWKDQQLANDLPWFHSFLQCFHLAACSHLLCYYCKYLRVVSGERIHSQICQEIPLIFAARLSLWFPESVKLEE